MPDQCDPNASGRAPLNGEDRCWISSDGAFCWAHRRALTGGDQ